MTTDKYDLLGPALAKVGEEAMAIVGGKPDAVYLYVEIGEGWVGPSLFKDEGNAVRYIDIGTSDIWRLLIDAWCIEPTDKRWTAMHYTIEGGKFDAQFEFDDLEGSDESTDDRRERVLHARYGDKPVIYPPMPAGSMELRPKP
ncbi:hypothetical protein [uncultured Sphingomonas sp.]|uniref:hypothetical protein n=1 Tax=uncultured Sphingomonas sp. TaxID=158754 RepID=UPI0035C98A80